MMHLRLLSVLIGLTVTVSCHAFSTVTTPTTSALGRENFPRGSSSSSIGMAATVASAGAADLDDSTSTISPNGENVSNANHSSKQKADPSIRPLHQNWWPIAFVNTLNKDAPNAERVLNKDIVLWHDGEEWRCMDDMCAHRFAPLSEGRVFVPGEGIGSGKLATNKFKKNITSKNEKKDNEKMRRPKARRDVCSARIMGGNSTARAHARASLRQQIKVGRCKVPTVQRK